jgi:hypothetical protein
MNATATAVILIFMNYCGPEKKKGISPSFITLQITKYFSYNLETFKMQTVSVQIVSQCSWTRITQILKGFDDGV